MTNTERLNSIVNQFNAGIQVWGIGIDDVEWLIEQAELKDVSEKTISPKLMRLNELMQGRVKGRWGDSVIEISSDYILKIEEQAERYKQALEEIKNYYDKHSWIPTAEFIGHLAKEALEGDE